VIECHCCTRDETKLLGQKIARLLKPGDVITLSGPMGAGKTVFVEGIALGLGCQENVSSPTFALAHEYPSMPPVVHIDAYRLKTYEEFCTAGLEEYLHGNAVCLIEWPDVSIQSLPQSRLDILIQGSGEEERRVFFRPMGPDWTERMEKLDENPSL